MIGPTNQKNSTDFWWCSGPRYDRHPETISGIPGPFYISITKAHLFQQQSTLLLTGGSAPFVWRRCDCLASSVPFTNTQTYLLTYLLAYLLTYLPLRNGGLGRLLAFLIQSLADFYDTWRSDLCRQRVNPLHSGSDPADIPMRIRVNLEIRIRIADHFCLRFWSSRRTCAL